MYSAINPDTHEKANYVEKLCTNRQTGYSGGKTIKLLLILYIKIGQGLLLTGDPHVVVVPPKYFFHAINVQQLIYVFARLRR